MLRNGDEIIGFELLGPIRFPAYVEVFLLERVFSVSIIVSYKPNVAFFAVLILFVRKIKSC